MDEFINALKRHVSDMQAQIAQPRFGTVVSYNPANHTAKVLIQPEGVLSGWLPICTGMTGTGWGIVAPPFVGEQVFMAPHDGDNSSYVILGSVFSQASLPPKPAAAIDGAAVPVHPGEVALVSQNGGVTIRLGADGSLFIYGSTAINVQTQTASVKAVTTNVTSPTVTISATTGLTVTSPLSTFNGDVTVSGDITDHSGSRGSVAALRTAYDTHLHRGVSAGTGLSGTTTNPVGS